MLEAPSAETLRRPRDVHGHSSKGWIKWYYRVKLENKMLEASSAAIVGRTLDVHGHDFNGWQINGTVMGQAKKAPWAAVLRLARDVRCMCRRAG